MFGNTNDIRNQTENVNTNESCFGGFGGRFSYEECQNVGLGGRICRSLPKIALGAVACLFLGMLGVLCTVMMYSIVSDNHSLYPSAQLPSADASDTAAPIHASAVVITANSQIMVDTVSAENVTAEQSRLYRVPMGVIIHEISENSAAYEAGFRSGDIIVALEGCAVSSIDTLAQMAREYKDGTVEITLFRDNSYMKIYASVE